MVIELRVVQVWSEIMLLISNRTCAACLSNNYFCNQVTMILDQIALHSVQYRFQLNFMNILRQLLEEKAPVNNVKEEFPMPRNTTASKVGNGIISLL